jgi:tRNA U38,U39,U40 pseudouridine synthase TruA
MAAPLAAAAIGLLAQGGTARAEAEDEGAKERCATRLSIAMLGKSASDALLKSSDPQASIDQMIADPAFIDRFATFINSTNNAGPGSGPGDDAVYYLAKYVLEKNLPWKNLYIGAYKVDVNADKSAMVVSDDPAGLGYFRSVPWQRRYAGNESAGYKLPTAFRMLQNTTGIELVASTNQPGDDVSATGRKSPQCASCHYEKWFALDKIAKVLTRRNGTDDKMTFTPPTEGPQQVLDGITVKDDKDVVTALVDSEAFRHRQCRLAFKFLYGRNENQCEAPLFDACMDAFKEKGTIQAAVATVAKDPGFCK